MPQWREDRAVETEANASCEKAESIRMLQSTSRGMPLIHSPQNGVPFIFTAVQYTLNDQASRASVVGAREKQPRRSQPASRPLTLMDKFSKALCSQSSFLSFSQRLAADGGSCSSVDLQSAAMQGKDKDKVDG
ncbi:hypothetical protein M513_03503 [Trichuris suis]|uniref:Uncharacterized protein n=1 Tax=Trichuris suis TaxID=68888 RepID=A0A085MEV9_9BILA|nr:hypothetical protein M513_03503 [Trichuris suis]